MFAGPNLFITHLYKEAFKDILKNFHLSCLLPSYSSSFIAPHVLESKTLGMWRKCALLGADRDGAGLEPRILPSELLLILLLTDTVSPYCTFTISKEFIKLLFPPEVLIRMLSLFVLSAMCFFVSE